MTEPRLLVDTALMAPIDTPLDRVDLANWLWTLTDAEYQRCAPGQHIAAGTTTTDDGRPMSINVELIGGSLIIQHYIAEIREPHHCLLSSVSDSYSNGVHTTVQVTWELTAEANGAEHSTFTNRVAVHTTDEFLALLDSRGIPFDAAAQERSAAVIAHNELETPLYAQSITRRANNANTEATHD